MKEEPAVKSILDTNRRFEFLDGLRGIAALLVVLFHFNNLLKKFSIVPFPFFIDWILRQGHSGVEIFFVLSGFVIAYSIRHQFISFSYMINFFIKRSIRLDPPYWATIFVLIFLSILGNLFKSVPFPLPNFKEIGLNFFYLTDFYQMERILPVSWTLALEIQFYVFFIFLAKLTQFLTSGCVSQTERSSVSFPVLIILGLLMLTSILQNTSYAFFPYIPGLFINHWYSFQIGFLVCWSMLNLIGPIFFWINFILMGCLAVLEHGRALDTCLISLILYFVANKDKMHSFLTSSIFQFLGKISYSLYLIHWVVGVKLIDFAIRFFKGSLDNSFLSILLICVALLLTIVAATVFYFLVERPSLRLSRKFKSSTREKLLDLSEPQLQS